MDMFEINELFVLSQAAMRNALLTLMSCMDESGFDLLFSAFFSP